MTANATAITEMRARVRVAIRLASKAGNTTVTLQRYYARLRDTSRPVPREIFAEMAKIAPPLRFLVFDGERK